MARNGSGTGLFKHPISPTAAAPTPALFGSVGVLFVVWVPTLAMCFRSLSSAIGLAAKRQPLFVNKPFFTENFIKRMTSLYSGNKGVCFYPNTRGNFCGNKFFTVDSNLAAVMQIPLLLLFRGPPTVFRRISAVIVGTVDAHSLRARANVLDKVPKPTLTGHNPSVTHFNASPAISMKRLISGVVAAIDHAAIYVVQRVGRNTHKDIVPVMVLGG